MLCNKCGKRQATVHYKQIINGKQTEIFLCPQCADSINAFGFDDFLPNLFGHVMKPKADNKSCPGCNLTLGEFTRKGRLGCAQCPAVFEEYLKPTLKKLHGSVTHTGRIPGRTAKEIEEKSELKKLREELNAAIAEENYEKAAELRDKIRAIEGKGGAADE